LPLARIGGTLLFFVHVPKTGGTSIEAYMRAKGSVALAGTRRHGWSRTTPQHIHRDIYAEMVPPDFYDHGFAVVRDPKARLFSEFRMRAEPLRPKLRPLGLMRVAWNRSRGVPTYGVRLGSRLEYLDFDAWVAKSFAAFRKDPYCKDNHIRPQHQFIDPGHRLFRFEDGLDPVFRWIDEVTATPPVPGTFHERRSSPVAFTCGEATDRLIREFYREDYALLDELDAGSDARA
jgi:hypothetical protein